MIDFESYLEDPEQTKLEWVEYKADKSFPIARWGHACISHLNNIYIIGYNDHWNDYFIDFGIVEEILLILMMFIAFLYLRINGKKSLQKEKLQQKEEDIQLKSVEIKLFCLEDLMELTSTQCIT